MKEPAHLNPANCALLAVDIQERLMPVISGGAEVAGNSARLLKAAKVMNIPVAATTQYAARIGELLPEIKAELGEVVPFDKMQFDCFADQVIRERVKGLGREVNTLIVCGVETHICIYQSVLGALREGYKVWVPADAVSSRTARNSEIGLARIRELGGTVGSTEMIIYDLLHRAGTPEFRELLPYLK
ncbi:MAG: isochorismatase family protein [Desulfurivibrionaceae bacterium]|nr:isochorismatase family protein [Desulfobulbales bacterium]MDT8335929.1 isochorismatase family protein [Desulfurivibrionaceae bacterium]